MLNRLFCKFFGSTEEEQFQYLKKRLLWVCVGCVMMLIFGIISYFGVENNAMTVFGIISAALCVWPIVVFGWNAMKGLLGITSFLAFMSHNIMIGIALFVLFVFLGYILGIIVSIIGICRFLVLLKHRKGE